jgi:hypothetical protein
MSYFSLEDGDNFQPYHYVISQNQAKHMLLTEVFVAKGQLISK